MDAIKNILDNEEAINEIVDDAFTSFDVDKSGLIDSSEMGTAMKTMSKRFGLEEPTIKEIRGCFKALDKDHSGKLSKDEFRGFVIHLLNMLSQNLA